VNLVEGLGCFAPHVAFEHGGMGFTQIDYHQAVEDIREFAVDVEA
jgi:hypothetical protein